MLRPDESAFLGEFGDRCSDGGEISYESPVEGGEAMKTVHLMDIRRYFPGFNGFDFGWIDFDAEPETI